jgi:hypothetical protein
MLVFLVPLKSATVARSWERVERLVRGTVRSACAQLCPDFRVIVACHEPPALECDDARIELLVLGAPPPDAGDPAALQRDKQRKIVAACRQALALAPSHVMVLDADDLVSRRLAGHVAAHPGADGWYIRQGYFLRDGERTTHVERRRFHRWCGSSYLVRPELLGIPDGDADGWHYFHSRLDRDLARRGRPLAPLPFPGAVYRISHGDNFRDYAPLLWPRHPLLRALRRLVFLRRIPRGDLQREFGL